LNRHGMVKLSQKVDYFNFWLFKFLIRLFGHMPKPKPLLPLDNPKDLG
jgi:hypothetical protein